MPIKKEPPFLRFSPLVLCLANALYAPAFCHISGRAFAPPSSFLFPLRCFSCFLYALPRFPLRLFLESRFPRFCLSRFYGMPFPPPFLLSLFPGFLAPLSHPKPFAYLISQPSRTFLSRFPPAHFFLLSKRIVLLCPSFPLLLCPASSLPKPFACPVLPATGRPFS